MSEGFGEKKDIDEFCRVLNERISLKSTTSP
jgi:hypothetical protein